MSLDAGEIIQLIKRDIFRNTTDLTLDVWAANLWKAKTRGDAERIARRVSKDNPAISEELPLVLEYIKKWS